MTRATILARRKHIYFYAVLVLATVAFAMPKPRRIRQIAEQDPCHGSQQTGQHFIPMKLLLALALFLQIAPAHAAHRLPLSQRTGTLQGSVSQPSTPQPDHVWKFTLLGLAALSFLIRKRL